MGFFEDDRIRSKNRVHNLAYNEFLALKKRGWSNKEIVAHYNSVQDQIRNEIHQEIIKIAGGSNEKTY